MFTREELEEMRLQAEAWMRKLRNEFRDAFEPAAPVVLDTPEDIAQPIIGTE